MTTLQAISVLLQNGVKLEISHVPNTGMRFRVWKGEDHTKFYEFIVGRRVLVLDDWHEVIAQIHEACLRFGIAIQ